MGSQPSLNLAICHRLLPMEKGARTGFPACLEEDGHVIEMIGDEPSQVPAGGILVICGNAVWFPRVRRRLLEMSSTERPLVVLWHAEPLPPPDSAGLRWPMLNLREIAKILLRDP